MALFKVKRESEVPLSVSPAPLSYRGHSSIRKPVAHVFIYTFIRPRVSGLFETVGFDDLICKIHQSINESINILHCGNEGRSEWEWRRFKSDGKGFLTWF